MLNFGWTELLLILGAALLIFGPGKLPEVGATLGKALREFKGAVNHIDADIKQEVNDIKQEVDFVKDAVDVKGAVKDLQQDLKAAVEDKPTAVKENSLSESAPLESKEQQENKA